MKLIKQKTIKEFDSTTKLFETYSGLFIVVNYFMNVELDRKSFITESSAIKLFNHWTRNVNI